MRASEKPRRLASSEERAAIGGDAYDGAAGAGSRALAAATARSQARTLAILPRNQRSILVSVWILSIDQPSERAR